MVAKTRGMNVSTTAAPITGATTAVLCEGRRKEGALIQYFASLHKSLIPSQLAISSLQGPLNQT